MKKIFAWLLIFALCFGLVACGASGDPEAKEEETGKAEGAVATVVTGETTVEARSLEEMANAVDPSGNSVITLLQDMDENKPIRLPYSCTFDFNGHTIHTSPNDGNGLEVAQAGEENAVTTIKNGTLTQYGVGVRINEGAFVIENMNIHSQGGTALAVIDPADKYKSINAIKGSTLSSETSCIIFYDPGVSYALTGITIEDSTLISYDPEGAEVFNVMGSGTTAGSFTLGENVQLYTYDAKIAPKDGYVYGGKIANKVAEAQVASANGKNYEGMNCWSTAEQLEPIDVLMIGNSFCYYYATELYNMAHAAGVEMNVTHLYEAGAFVEEHWTWLTNKEEGLGKYTYWVIDSMGRWNPLGITSSFDALPYMEWDVITLQQHFSPECAADYETARASCDPYVKDLYDYLKKEYPNADLYWHQTWAYQAGHAEIPDTKAQTNQQNIINTVSDEICQENGVNKVPSGDAWVIARKTVGDILCQEDLYHDGDIGGGQYLNACVWLEVLTGKSCVGNTWRPDYELSEDLIAQLQQAAHQAVAACYGEDYAK